VLVAAVDLEMELRTTAPSVEGGLGIVDEGVPALEGVGRIHVPGGAVSLGGETGSTLHQVYQPERRCDQ
jgi:hypothetical protein